MRLSRTPLFALLSAAALAFSCAGGSGVDRTKYLDELTASEVSSFCSYYVDSTATTSVTCGQLTFSAKTQGSCESEARPHCAVAVVEDCLDALGGDVCKLFSEEPCKAYLTCAAALD